MLLDRAKVALPSDCWANIDVTFVLTLSAMVVFPFLGM